MTPKPLVVTQNAPIKLMVTDLKRVSANKSKGCPWKILVPSGNTNQSAVIEFCQVWLQGSINRCSDLETIVLNDGSGNVRVKKCSRVPGDRAWIKPGAYCGVLACVQQPSGDTPVVEAIKLMHIDEMKIEARSVWPLEVQELVKFLVGEITFNL